MTGASHGEMPPRASTGGRQEPPGGVTHEAKPALRAAPEAVADSERQAPDLRPCPAESRPEAAGLESPHRAVAALRMKALAVALAARAGTLSEADVRQLVALAARVADPVSSPADRLRRAALHFATIYRAVHRCPEDLADEGGTLLRLIELAVMPVPPGQDRADIHG